MTNIKNEFWNANNAFEYFYKTISKHGIKFADTRAMFNVGFTILKPEIRTIVDSKRNWNHEYAEAEWQWYLSGDKSIFKLGDIYGKIPPIWSRMADPQGNVNSNYGYQWQRNDQIGYVIDKLKRDMFTRHACISIYDGKEHDKFATDTPCTYAIQFTNVNNYLNMCVTMRSNDLWYGFCNDQYQFSKLQELICKETGLDMGTYYHFAHNLHIYSDKLGL
jgi:thymidylate synthase